MKYIEEAQPFGTDETIALFPRRSFTDIFLLMSGKSQGRLLLIGSSDNHRPPWDSKIQKNTSSRREEKLLTSGHEGSVTSHSHSITAAYQLAVPYQRPGGGMRVPVGVQHLLALGGLS